MYDFGKKNNIICEECTHVIYKTNDNLKNLILWQGLFNYSRLFSKKYPKHIYFLRKEIVAEIGIFLGWDKNL